MKLFGTVLRVIAMSATAVLAWAGPSEAAGGEVVVFTTELEELDRYRDLPAGGCRRLPPTAHLLINLTDSKVFIHAGPLCLGPGVPVEPNHGWHAPPGGQSSFSTA